MEKKLEITACENVDFIRNKTQIVYADILDACNYSCPYCCAAHFRAGRDRKLDLDVFGKWLSRVAVPGKNLTVQILGGEPTLHPQLLSFCRENEWFHKNVFTNFSASLDFYAELLGCQDIELTLSYHTVDSSSPEAFFKKWQQLPEDKIRRVFVSVMAENEHFAESKRVFELLHAGYLARGISTQNLDVSLLLSSKTHHVSYSSQQLREYEEIHGKVVYKEYELYRCKLAGGQIAEMSEDDLFEQLGDDYFHGWLCSASQNCFYVSAGGEVYDCPMCHAYAGDSQRYVVGNVYSDKLPKRRQIICPFRYYCNMPELPKQKLFNF